MKPESMTIVNFAGGMMDFRLKVNENNVTVEEWAHRDMQSEMVFTGKQRQFHDTAAAWKWIGEELQLVKKDIQVRKVSNLYAFINNGD
jgi:hypothetical protein